MGADHDIAASLGGIADDHAGYVLGADGNRRAYTPKLDRLASEGTRFAANYCNSPVCTPSRQSILTGQLPHSSGVTVLNTGLAAAAIRLAAAPRRGAHASDAEGGGRRSASGQ